jgi:hypothetical protein
MSQVLSKLFPKSAKVLLTGTGRDFVKRLGESVTREAILGVLKGENLRSQTEFLTRQRISQLSAALVSLYLNGRLLVPGFSKKLFELATDQLKTSKKNEKSEIWIAQWFLGLTGKSVQNVLKSERSAHAPYVTRLAESLDAAAKECLKDLGDVRVVMGWLENNKLNKSTELGWNEILQLTTAIGAQTLAIRGSDKSMYGKLFEKLVLGSVLSILGFKRIDPPKDREGLRQKGVFWLSDTGSIRESDATALYEPFKLARFDIGFIGPGNSEISKDKLSRFAAEDIYLETKTYTKTFVVVDRLPNTGRTQAAAKQINAEIIQMSMKYWPRELALKLEKQTGYKHELVNIPDDKVGPYLEKMLKAINVLEFIETVKLDLSDI